MIIGGGSSNNIAQLEQRIRDLSQKKVEAGWFDSAKYAEGEPVAGIMAQNEFGNPARNIPARPFMRNAIEQDKSDWTNTARQGFRASLNGNVSADQVFNTLGLVVVGSIKDSIVNGSYQGLAQSTIDARLAKGRTNTDVLRDTSFAISTLTHEVK